MILALVPPAGAADEGQSPPGPPPIQEPFLTPLPWSLPEAHNEWSARLNWERRQPPPFPGEHASRPDRSTGMLSGSVTRGLSARVEASLAFSAQRIDEPGGEVSTEPGDLRARFAYALLGTYRSASALAATFTAKIPTAPEDAGAGTDEADVGGVVSAGWRVGRGGLFAAGGLELLGNPLENGSQDDVATYGAGGWIAAGRSLQVTGEIAGRLFSRFGNSSGSARAGTRWAARRRAGSWMAIAVTLERGITSESALWGAALSVSVLPSRSRDGGPAGAAESGIETESDQR